MKLLASREYSVIDYQTLAEFIGHERLFRMPNGQLLLHMASERDPEADERVIWLNLRDAMTWLNEPPEQYGSFYVTTTAWKEVCTGFDPRRTAAVMKQKGYIDAGEEGRSSKSVRVPEFGKQRLYHIRSTFLEDANEA
ncbi:MAG: putative primase/helicase [Acidobacteriaceae bacterium]|jgi:hypothetical protein|nr:putative primase/helicase [Acidobacteriaceae bacterium]